MQAYAPDGVRLERTGWRDQEISARHRLWGFNCPAADLDFLLVEYNVGKPVGLVEYKHYQAQMPDMKHATYRALADLADGYRNVGLPFWIAFYWPECWAFRVMPVNASAKEHFRHMEDLSEFDYVVRMYQLRRMAFAHALAGQLSKMMPPMGSNGNGRQPI